MDRRRHRTATLLVALTWMVGGSWAGNAQEPPRRVITGDSERLTTDDVDLLRIHFEAGARTYWHVHENPQIYLVEAGRGRIQIRGSEIQDVLPGEPVYMPANVAHWHGAAPDQSATCLHAYPGGVAITLLDEVTEDEYLGRGR